MLLGKLLQSFVIEMSLGNAAIYPFRCFYSSFAKYGFVLGDSPDSYGRGTGECRFLFLIWDACSCFPDEPEDENMETAGKVNQLLHSGYCLLLYLKEQSPSS